MEVTSYAQAVDKCRIHSQIVGASAAGFGFMFAFLRSRHRYPDLVKNNHTIVPVLAAISTIVGYSLHKYSHSSCLDRYAAKFPAEAAEWKRLMKEKIEKEGN